MLTLESAKQKAELHGVDVNKCETLLNEVSSIYRITISDKYQLVFFLASSGCFSAPEIAEKVNQTPKNMNSEFNKNLGQYLKLYFDLEEKDRLGITSLRRFLFKEGYLKKLNKEPYLSNRHQKKPDSVLER
ncbi:hypothetical protein [Crocosphaera watsonii]|uniref:hypothetical protein n=1 Tax=Crocosphaera watsonii TaxID=263511 RepID=UPI00065165A6|nr:hypothetical protein [Crocosphaera watsonii]